MRWCWERSFLDTVSLVLALPTLATYGTMGLAGNETTVGSTCGGRSTGPPPAVCRTFAARGEHGGGGDGGPRAAKVIFPSGLFGLRAVRLGILALFWAIARTASSYGIGLKAARTVWSRRLSFWWHCPFVSFGDLGADGGTRRLVGLELLPPASRADVQRVSRGCAIAYVSVCWPSPGVNAWSGGTGRGSEGPLLNLNRFSRRVRSCGPGAGGDGACGGALAAAGWSALDWLGHADATPMAWRALPWPGRSLARSRGELTTATTALRASVDRRANWRTG